MNYKDNETMFREMQEWINEEKSKENSEFSHDSLAQWQKLVDEWNKDGVSQK